MERLYKIQLVIALVQCLAFMGWALVGPAEQGLQTIRLYALASCALVLFFLLALCALPAGRRFRNSVAGFATVVGVHLVYLSLQEPMGPSLAVTAGTACGALSLVAWGKQEIVLVVAGAVFLSSSAVMLQALPPHQLTMAWPLVSLTSPALCLGMVILAIGTGRQLKHHWQHQHDREPPAEAEQVGS